MNTRNRFSWRIRKIVIRITLLQKCLECNNIFSISPWKSVGYSLEAPHGDASVYVMSTCMFPVEVKVI